MPSPAIDPVVRQFLMTLSGDERHAIMADLDDIESAAADPLFVATDFGIAFSLGEEIVYQTRVGRHGKWWVFWRLLPTDPPPMRWLHVLHIEVAPPLPVL